MKAQCQSCGQKLDFPPSMKGSEIECRECGNMVLLDPDFRQVVIQKTSVYPPELPSDPHRSNGSKNCGNCGGITETYAEKPQEESGCLIIVIALVFTPFLIGIPVLIFGIYLFQKRERYWRCLSCGAKIPRY